MKSLLRIIQEAEEKAPPSKQDFDNWLSGTMQAKKTPIPKALGAVKAHLWNTGEYELFEFLNNSSFYEVQNKNAPHWHQSAAVNVFNDRVNFFYDKEFVERLANKPGELIFLIAHEASHILRHHIDRSVKAGHDGDKANTAQDMIINDDIMRSKKIAGWEPKLITKGTFHGNKGADADEVAVWSVPEKFVKDHESVGRKAYYYENMYDWLNKNKDDDDEEDGEDGEPQEQDYFKEGSIVKVTDGPNKGQYKKITKVNGDGTFETEPVDIDAEIEKVKGS